MKTLFFIISLLFPITVCYSGTIDQDTPDTAYIEYAKDFQYVGLLCGSYENGDMFCASAVGIDDHNILTAAHVVEGVKHCIFSLNNEAYCISEVIVHPNFKATKFGHADIAIGHCKMSFDLKFYPALYGSSDENKKLCCMSGYGFTGTFLTGSIKHDSIKRAGSNIIDKIEKDLLICSPSKKSDSCFTSLEFLIANGDSGGGLFIEGRLAGINSCVMADGKNPESKYNEESGHTRVSKFIEWIEKHKLTP